MTDVNATIAATFTLSNTVVDSATTRHYFSLNPLINPAAVYTGDVPYNTSLLGQMVELLAPKAGSFSQGFQGLELVSFPANVSADPGSVLVPKPPFWPLTTSQSGGVTTGPGGSDNAINNVYSLAQLANYSTYLSYGLDDPYQLFSMFGGLHLFQYVTPPASPVMPTSPPLFGSATPLAAGAWWSMDMGMSFTVVAVAITGPETASLDAGWEVALSSTPIVTGTEGAVLLGTGASPAVAAVGVHSFAANATGRYLVVRYPAALGPKVLALGQVDVYVDLYSFVPDPAARTVMVPKQPFWPVVSSQLGGVTTGPGGSENAVNGLHSPADIARQPSFMALGMSLNDVLTAYGEVMYFDYGSPPVTATTVAFGSATPLTTGAWWSLDLSVPMPVTGVRVTGDSALGLDAGWELALSSTPIVAGTEGTVLLGTGGSPRVEPLGGYTVTLAATGAVTGRYLVVRYPAALGPKVLALGQVDMYVNSTLLAKTAPTAAPLTASLAYDSSMTAMPAVGATTSSSVVLDGVTTTNSTATCTNLQPKSSSTSVSGMELPWITIDLGAAMSVGTVQVFVPDYTATFGAASTGVASFEVFAGSTQPALQSSATVNEAMAYITALSNDREMSIITEGQLGKPYVFTRYLTLHSNVYSSSTRLSMCEVLIRDQPVHPKFNRALSSQEQFGMVFARFNGGATAVSAAAAAAAAAPSNLTANVTGATNSSSAAAAAAAPAGNTSTTTSSGGGSSTRSSWNATFSGGAMSAVVATTIAASATASVAAGVASSVAASVAAGTGGGVAGVMGGGNVAGLFSSVGLHSVLAASAFISHMQYFVMTASSAVPMSDSYVRVNERLGWINLQFVSNLFHDKSKTGTATSGSVTGTIVATITSAVGAANTNDTTLSISSGGGAASTTNATDAKGGSDLTTTAGQLVGQVQHFFEDTYTQLIACGVFVGGVLVIHWVAMFAYKLWYKSASRKAMQKAAAATDEVAKAEALKGIPTLPFALAFPMIELFALDFIRNALTSVSSKLISAGYIGEGAVHYVAGVLCAVALAVMYAINTLITLRFRKVTQQTDCNVCYERGTKQRREAVVEAAAAKLKQAKAAARGGSGDDELGAFEKLELFNIRLDEWTRLGRWNKPDQQAAYEPERTQRYLEAGMNVFQAVRCLALGAQGPHHQRSHSDAAAPAAPQRHGSHDHFHMGAKVVPASSPAGNPWMPAPPPAPLPPAPTPLPPPVPTGNEGQPAVPAYTTSAAGSGSTRTSASLTDDYGLGHDSTDGGGVGAHSSTSGGADGAPAEEHYPMKPPQPKLQQQEQPLKESMGKGAQGQYESGMRQGGPAAAAAAGKGSEGSSSGGGGGGGNKAAALLAAEAVTPAGLEMYERFGLLVQDMRGENPRFAYMLMSVLQSIITAALLGIQVGARVERGASASLAINGILLAVRLAFGLYLVALLPYVSVVTNVAEALTAALQSATAVVIVMLAARGQGAAADSASSNEGLTDALTVIQIITLIVQVLKISIVAILPALRAVVWVSRLKAQKKA
ncbi:hypothetical protein HYH02_011356 [Chlamydomonas schloesseri]|uniref:Uncharacterized protein n=1 Tax=Chlamydomonas schloesseri TaxID=2026947 RepID=A0A835W4L0_9CHLO|nr:hypothetical protein HYH02_011356 [Chlamydomonas schloesseri]|eukprot:KAG2437098.1 hypothetical protein HYH02_011356 [Chlamydomonas schloesseri]